METRGLFHTFFLLFISLFYTSSSFAQDSTEANSREQSVALAKSRTFALEQVNDSLSVLCLQTGQQVNKWKLPYPVYQFQTGDVDGDGTVEALVGVVKSTRFYPEKGRRIFIFKNYHGKIRAMWMGSKLGGILHDFRFTDGKIRSLEATTDGRFVVAEYQWAHFGVEFCRFLATNVSLEEAKQSFNAD